MENEINTDSKSSKSKTPDKIINFLFYVSIILFFIAFNFNDTPPFGWYQQFLPNLNGRSVTDIFFLDSLTGWSVTNATNQINDTAYVLKTTNGGDNWVIQYRKIQTGGGSSGYVRVYFLNQTTGFACGVNGIFKSTNGGTNWVSIEASGNTYDNMSILNQDTIWIVSSESLMGGVFLTTNGGTNWNQQFSGGTSNPNKIYMYNTRIGFIVNNTNGSGLRKTTNGGLNWFVVVPNEGFSDMYFADSLTGWRVNDYVKKTTDGGITWFQQQLPQGVNGQSIVFGIRSITKNNRDTIWGSYAGVFFPNSQARGIVYRTTNGGNNWFYQIPDTTIKLGAYLKIQFNNKNIGWAYAGGGGIHTVTGGDTTFLTTVHKINSEVPKDYKLYQNYPNPFNQFTIINYQCTIKSNIKIKVYDISGKEMAILVNQINMPGNYQVKFDGGNLSSGIYFYTLFVNGKVIDTKKAVLIK